MSTDDTITAWGNHVDGAVALTKLRGREQFEDPMSHDVFRAVRTMMVHTPLAPTQLLSLIIIDHILCSTFQTHRLFPRRQRLACILPVRRKRRQPPDPHMHRPPQHPLPRQRPHQNPLRSLPRAGSPLHPRPRRTRRFKPPRMVPDPTLGMALPHRRHPQRTKRRFIGGRTLDGRATRLPRCPPRQHRE